MKFKIIFVAFYGVILLCCDCSFYIRDIIATSSAIAEVCDKFFVEESINFDVIIYGPTSNHLEGIVNGFLSHIVEKTSTTVKYVNDTDKWNHKIESSAVLFFDNSKQVEKFHKNVKLENFSPKELKFLTFSDENLHLFPSYDLTFSETTDIASHEYYIVNQRNIIKLITVENFNNTHCNQPKPTLLNTFYKPVQKWDKPLENHKKFRNFNGCNLLVLDGFGPSLYFKAQNDKVFKCYSEQHESCHNYVAWLEAHSELQGFTVDLFQIIQKVANFKPIFKIKKRKTIDQHLKKFPKIETKSLIFNQTLNVGYFPTALTFESSYMFAVTPTKSYTNYEKMLLPFDNVTWNILIFTFTTAFAVVFVLKFIDKRVRNAIVGKRISSPGLNVIHIFFGIAQMRLPVASIPRFLLMMFITFCLIFRTCYQSKLFEFMSSNMRKPLPSTVEDLIKENYTIVSCGGQLEFVLLRQIIQNNTNL